MKPFLHGKKNLAMASLRVPAGLVSTSGHAHGAAQSALSAPAVASSANVEAIKEGDKIVRLIVTCACGERTEIECLYRAGE